MIQPNTTVILLSGIPFDNTYEHTVSFPNREAQYVGLCSNPIASLSNLTYQRYSKNSIRVEKPIEEIEKCNYMAYKNSNYENKWIYAFITRMDYVSDSTTEIFYEIDVMQTWFLFDTVKEQSFIVREHTVTDEIGDNIVDEGISTGEYLFENYQKIINELDDMSVIIAFSDTDNFGFHSYDGGFSGAKMYAIKATNITRIRQLLNSYIEKPEAIVSIYLVPTIAIDGNTDSQGLIAENTRGNSLVVQSPDAITKTTPFGSNEDGTPLIPRNKKLYTYPYNFYHVDNGSSESLDLRYEFFDNLKPQFTALSSFTQPVSIVLYPENYKLTQRRVSDINYAEKITLSNYPNCSWSYDTYKNWLASESIPIALGGLIPALQATAGLSNASQIGGTQALQSTGGIFSYILSMLSQNYRMSIKADVMRGNSVSSSVKISHGMQNFFGARVHITPEYMKIIDDYFTMYGYQVNRVKKIEYRNRPYFTYVKTAGANLHSNCGNVYTRKMCEILDKGITFWKDSIGIVCNYNLDNSPN